MAKIDKTMLRNEYRKAFHSDDSMVNYCTGKAAAVAVLPTGELLTVSKQGIETQFCFGESGYDYDVALAAAETARTSELHFKNENMAYYLDWVRNLLDARSLDARRRLVIYDTKYTHQDPECMLRGYSLERTSDIIQALGGSCFLRDLPGTRIELDGRRCRVATQEELDALLAAFEEAAAAHAKKVDSYLKRYGLSKVHAWTYWRDA